MKPSHTLYLSIAACVACTLLFALAWSQFQKDDSKRVETSPSLQSTDITSEQTFNTPIQPIFVQNNLNQEIVALGDMLFHDPRLSSENNVSCASCHDLNRGGVDRLPGSVGVNGGVGNINSPTVFNASLNIGSFWDGQVELLDKQTDKPIHNLKELGINWPQVISKLKSDLNYSGKFNNLYPDGINESNLKNAISTFEKTLLTINSPFDRYLQGELSAISQNAKRGYAKFKEYGCIACHQGRNVGGNMYQPLGIMRDYFSDRGTAIKKGDLGLFNITGLEEDKYIFRVPSLRLASLTPPYFHDGSAATLKDAVRIMIKYQLGRTAPEQDEDLIIDFINSLVGEYKGVRLIQ